jgi:predicted ATPase/DNA-binding CsgD family transcriptional regulator
MSRAVLPNSSGVRKVESPSRGELHAGLPPVPATPFLGRQSALSDLRRLLAQHRARLLTLTGPGGTGKTRLALELAVELGSAFDRTWFVDLTTIGRPELVVSALAQALDVQESGSKSLNASLLEVLSAQPALLIFDNFEHVMDAAGMVADLLGACPELVVITTSREPLGLRSEHVYLVEPLAVPDLGQVADVAEMRQVPSVMLFEERARARRASFQLTDEALVAVAEICVRLDGLPLAIELAAAQAAVLTPAAILKRLESRAPLIGVVHRDLPARHQTLQAAVGWSYDLLEPTEQAVFRLCGVFSGGFTAAALAHVAERLAPGVDTLAMLAQLVTRSLVRVAEDSTDEPRFWQLEVIRAYAVEQLRLCGELAEARARHADYYQEIAEGLQTLLRGRGMAAALDQVAHDYGNFRAVFQWASESGELSIGLRLAGALYRFWLARGPVSEARDWLETALLQSQSVPPPIRAAALNAAGVMAGLQVDHERAIEAFRESLQLWEAVGDVGRQAGAHLNIGLVAHVTGGTSEAQAEFTRAQELFLVVGDRSGQARAVASRARLAREQDDLAEAMRLAEEALRLFESVGDEWGTGHQLANIGHIKLALDDRRGAAEAFRQALLVWRSLGNIVDIAECLDGLAMVVASVQPRRAAHLLGAAEALRERSGAAIAAVEQGRYRELVERVQKQLRESTFAAAWREGRALPIHRAIDVALQEERGEAQTASVLSARELEIARLIVQGNSNNDIAESLVLSIKTVESHLKHIFQKLHVKKRAEVAAWVVREGVG